MLFSATAAYRQSLFCIYLGLLKFKLPPSTANYRQLSPTTADRYFAFIKFNFNYNYRELPQTTADHFLEFF
jgi:hypothetical protein